MRGYIDLHCHVLPGLDDGPQDLESAAQTVHALEALGFAELHPTPHQKADAWAPDAGQCQQAAAALRAHLGERCSTTVHPPAGENMWDELFLSRQVDRSYPCYPGAKAFLLELHPAAPPPGLVQGLFEFRLRGQLPVLAHVERYLTLVQDLARVETIASKAALLVNRFGSAATQTLTAIPFEEFKKVSQDVREIEIAHR